MNYYLSPTKLAACQCNNALVGIPARQQTGMGALGALDLPPNQAGASFALGVELNGLDILTDFSTWTMSGLLEDVRQAVQSGGFVQIPVRVYSLASWNDFNPFIVIEGRAQYAHSSASHLRDAVLSAVQSVIGYNAGSVRFEADTYNPVTGQVNQDPAQRRYDAPSGGGTTPPPNPDKPSLLEKMASELGIGKNEVLALGVVGIIGLGLWLKR